MRTPHKPNHFTLRHCTAQRMHTSCCLFVGLHKVSLAQLHALLIHNHELVAKMPLASRRFDHMEWWSLLLACRFLAATLLYLGVSFLVVVFVHTHEHWDIWAHADMALVLAPWFCKKQEMAR